MRWHYAFPEEKRVKKDTARASFLLLLKICRVSFILTKFVVKYKYSRRVFARHANDSRKKCGQSRSKYSDREMIAVKNSKPRILPLRRAALFACALAGCLLLAACGRNKENPASASSASAQTTVPSVSGATSPSTLTVPQVGWCNVDEDGLHVRSGPGNDYRVIGGMKYGEKVYILGREGDWYKIEFAGGTAYVSAAFVQDTEIPEGATYPGSGSTASGSESSTPEATGTGVPSSAG